MIEHKFSAWFAFSFLLLLTLTISLLIQTAGYIINVSFARYSMVLALPLALYVTYGRSFALGRKEKTISILSALLLLLLGFLSRYLLDFTPDGMGYQQPSAEAIMRGWNPFGPDADMLWQNIYPSGVWAVEASLAFLYGSVEATKMIQIWWIFVALPIFLTGISFHKGKLGRIETILVFLTILSAIVLNQSLTHYVDAMVYLSGMTFLGGLLLYGKSERGNRIAMTIMAACILFIVNTKLSGIYHAVTLCIAAVSFTWLRSRSIPWKFASVLLIAGMTAVLIIGYRPYVTSFEKYGPSLFPDSTESFSGAQRPSSFDGLPAYQRFAYSLFSIDGGAPHEPAQLKWPWTVGPLEWKFSGDPDARTGGYGPLFALGFLISIGALVYAILKKLPIDGLLISLSTILLLSSALFPQSWWARYVPFAYAVPFLLLFSIKTPDQVLRVCIVVAACIFTVNSAMAESAGLLLFYNNQYTFMQTAALLKQQPQGSVYLVPPVANYRKYNDAYMAIERRLKAQGVEIPLKVGVPCPNDAAMLAEYRICY